MTSKQLCINTIMVEFVYNIQ